MYLPKPIYEGLPYFLVAVGTVFVTLVLHRYEYAPILFTWLLGMLCIIAGLLLIGIRFVVRRRNSRPGLYDTSDNWESE